MMVCVHTNLSKAIETYLQPLFCFVLKLQLSCDPTVLSSLKTRVANPENPHSTQTISVQLGERQRDDRPARRSSYF